MENKIIDFQTEINEMGNHRLKRAKWGYSTRTVSNGLGPLRLLCRDSPTAGDLVLAKVEKIGQHQRLELANGRRARLFVGDEIVVVYGNRYAPDQFEAIVPSSLRDCHLIAAGGIAGKMVYKHGAIKSPTRISPIGILTYSNGKVVNLSDFGLKKNDTHKSLPPVIAVVGGSMNAGKTTAAASLIHGLYKAGYKVSAGKVTGTGAGGDSWHFIDAGGSPVLDFLDTGHPSTYLLSAKEVVQIFEILLSHLNTPDTDYIVIEVADGLFQTETVNLINSTFFKQSVSGVIYAAADAVGAVYGINLLKRWGLPICAVSGTVTRSPLGMREILDSSDIPIISKQALRKPNIVDHLSVWLEGGQHRSEAWSAV